MKEIILRNGDVTMVDDDWYDELSKHRWCCMSHGNTKYAFRTEMRNGKKITVWMHGVITKTSPTDHIDHDGLNNQSCNLRGCTPKQNQHNSRLRKNKTSKYKGVQWEPRRRNWRSSIRIDGRSIRLGAFKDEETAGIAYDSAARHFFKEFACVNFPDVVVPYVHRGYIRKARGYDRLPSGRYRVYLSVNARMVTIGTFDTEEEAIRVRAESEVKYKTKAS